MKKISIKETTFERLRRHAKPLEDTSDTVINRALDALEMRDGNAAPPERADDERRIDPSMLPDLRYTKIIDASVDGSDIARPEWIRLFGRIVILATKKLPDLEKVKQLCSVKMVEGWKKDKGYHYLEEIDKSVQGKSANATCQSVVTAAQELGISINIGLQWRRNKKAPHPGERARLVISES